MSTETRVDALAQEVGTAVGLLGRDKAEVADLAFPQYTAERAAANFWSATNRGCSYNGQLYWYDGIGDQTGLPDAGGAWGFVDMLDASRSVHVDLLKTEHTVFNPTLDSLPIGTRVRWDSYYPPALYSSGTARGAGQGVIVASGTGTADGGRYIDLANTQIKATIGWEIDVCAFGAGRFNVPAESQINAAVAFAQTRITALVYPTLYFPAEKYRHHAGIVIPRNIHVDSELGAELTSYSAIFPLLTIGDSTAINSGMKLTLPQVNHAGFNGTRFPDSKDAAALRIVNLSQSIVFCQRIAGTTIGLQMMATNGKALTGNHVTVKVIQICKHNLHLYGLGTGWINDSTFTEFGITSTSPVDRFGSQSGIWFDSNGGVNNNRFRDFAFQMGYKPSTVWTTGGTGVQKDWRYFYDEREYRVMSAGNTQVFGTTPPTDTSGNDFSDGSVTLRYIGPFYRSAIRAGLGCHSPSLEKIRIEGGYGAILVHDENVDGSYVSPVAPVRVLIDGGYLQIEKRSNADPFDFELEKRRDGQIGTEAIIRTDDYSAGNDSALRLDDISDSLLYGAGGWSANNVYFAENGAAIDSGVTNIRNAALLEEGMLCFRCWALIDVRKSRRISLFPQCDYDGFAPAMKAMALDVDKNVLSMTNENRKIGLDLSPTYDYTNNIAHTGMGTGEAFVQGVAIAALSEDVKYIAVGMYSNTPYQGHTIQQPKYRTGKPHQLRSALPVSSLRMSHGIPIVGKFPALGEIIADHAGTASYEVTTTGVLGPQWAATNQEFWKGGYITNAGNTYIGRTENVNAGARGAMSLVAPTHTSGTVSDGSGDYEYVGPAAVLATQ